MRPTLGVVLAILLQQPPSVTPPVFRSGAHLVQVNVVVHDKHGPVADLTKEDFRLVENGKPQDISFFSVDSSKSFAASPKPERLPFNTFTNALTVHENVPTNVTVVLIDLLNSSVGDQMRARVGLLKFLGQIQPQDRLAIFAMTQHGLALLHDYTSDSAALLERVRTSKPQVSTTYETSLANSRLEQDLHAMGLDGLSDAEQVAADFENDNRIQASLSALLAVADHLAGVPGRKSLVWLSSGFPLAVGLRDDQGPGTLAGPRSPGRNWASYEKDADRLTRALNNAGIAVYPVDARGLFNPAYTDTSSAATSRWNEMPNISAQNNATSTMFVMAERTGGRVGYGQNDIGAALRQALDDSSVTYTLGYYPAAPADDKWRDIKVSVNRPGVDVRARKGYYALRPASEAVDARRTAIRGAVWSPIEATTLPIVARVEFTNDPPDTVEAIVQLDPRNVSFEHKDGRWRAQLDMVFVQKDPHGLQLGEGGMESLTIALTDENYAKVQAEGLRHRYRGRREAAASTMRIVVRDTATGAVGSLTVPFAQVR